MREILRDMNLAIAGFVRGQGTVCLILGVYYATGLTLTGLNFGLLIGVFAGLISFIPFVGSILGGLLSIGVAAAQFWNDPIWIAAVALGARVLGDGYGLRVDIARYSDYQQNLTRIAEAFDRDTTLPGRFALTVGTADVAAQEASFPHLPAAITAQPEVNGFLELAAAVLAARPPR